MGSPRPDPPPRAPKKQTMCKNKSTKWITMRLLMWIEDRVNNLYYRLFLEGCWSVFLFNSCTYVGEGPDQFRMYRLCNKNPRTYIYIYIHTYVYIYIYIYPPNKQYNKQPGNISSAHGRALSKPFRCTTTEIHRLFWMCCYLRSSSFWALGSGLATLTLSIRFDARCYTWRIQRTGILNPRE